MTDLWLKEVLFVVVGCVAVDSHKMFGEMSRLKYRCEKLSRVEDLGSEATMVVIEVQQDGRDGRSISPPSTFLLLYVSMRHSPLAILETPFTPQSD
jgi:hypothetical protein